MTRPLSRSFTGWFAPWWPNFILKVFAPDGQRHDLVAEADAEGRDAALDQLARRGDRVVARLRVARAVGQEDAVGLERQHFGAPASAPARTVTLAAALGQHAQDVVLDAVVVGDDVEPRRRSACRSRVPSAPLGLASIRRARVALTTLARSRPAMPARARPRERLGDARRRRPLALRPARRCSRSARLLRSRRVSLRVSMSAIATTCLALQVFGEVCAACGSSTRAAAGRG